MKTFLHVGCGQNHKERTTRAFCTDAWQEVRFDIDPAANPDIVGTMTDMSAVADSSFDAVFSSHNIEHLNAFEVPRALGEFNRVLKADGFLVLTCPDLQSVCALVAEGKLLEPAYVSPSGPISPLDILYGHRPSLAAGNMYMAHRCGFTKKVLSNLVAHSGFRAVASMKRGAPYFDLWVLGLKSNDKQLAGALAVEHFPRKA
ncbi:MAG: class I SAM-dependent methyltransferase [Desulfovibrio sp.]|nr:class I SAM-dependent methyltransferase [Desulfovibrio sp.]